MIESQFDYEQAQAAEKILVQHLVESTQGYSRGLYMYAKRESIIFHLTRLRNQMKDYLDRGQNTANQERPTGD
jgi:hypothetical protein